MELEKIIKEMEKTGDYYRRTPFNEIKEIYENEVILIISNLPEIKQYDLYKYWDKLKKPLFKPLSSVNNYGK